MKIVIDKKCATIGWAFTIVGEVAEVPDHVGELLIGSKNATKASDDAVVKHPPAKKGTRETGPSSSQTNAPAKSSQTPDSKSDSAPAAK